MHIQFYNYFLPSRANEEKTAGHFKIQQSITYCLCVHWNQPITLSNKIYGSCRLSSINYPHGRINIVSLYTKRFIPFTQSVAKVKLEPELLRSLCLTFSLTLCTVMWWWNMCWALAVQSEVKRVKATHVYTAWKLIGFVTNELIRLIY